MRKNRDFPKFLHEHKEIFSTLPELAGYAAREMLTVNGVAKKQKQAAIWKTVRKKMSLMKLLRLLWDGWRAVK